MKNLSKYTALFLLALMVSCKDEAPKMPKVSYDASKEKVTTKVDSSQIEIADLPVQMRGTNYLIHPVGDLNVYEGRTKSSYGSTNSDRSFTISNTSEFEITGYLRNLKFQQVGSDSIKALTDKPILIQTATYIRLYGKAKQQLMVYTMADSDTNKDGKIDTSDIKTLYISDVSGTRLTKFSTDFQELIDWNFIDSNNRLYFRTIEDTNKNGQFDKNDVVHYNFVDLANKEWKVAMYNPI
ncbi:MAG: hypothetical protein V4548_05890 [Bacteroidota bacterium]